MGRSSSKCPPAGKGEEPIFEEKGETFKSFVFLEGRPKPEERRDHADVFERMLLTILVEFRRIQAPSPEVQDSFILFNLPLASASILAQDFGARCFIRGRIETVDGRKKYHLSLFEEDGQSVYRETDKALGLLSEDDLRDFYLRHGGSPETMKKAFAPIRLWKIHHEDAFGKSFDDTTTERGRYHYRILAYTKPAKGD